MMSTGLNISQCHHLRPFQQGRLQSGKGSCTGATHAHARRQGSVRSSSTVLQQPEIKQKTVQIPQAIHALDDMLPAHLSSAIHWSFMAQVLSALMQRQDLTREECRAAVTVSLLCWRAEHHCDMATNYITLLMCRVLLRVTSMWLKPLHLWCFCMPRYIH